MVKKGLGKRPLQPPVTAVLRRNNHFFGRFDADGCHNKVA
jgi:hypothetical protein